MFAALEADCNSNLSELDVPSPPAPNPAGRDAHIDIDLARLAITGLMNLSHFGVFALDGTLWGVCKDGTLQSL